MAGAAAEIEHARIGATVRQGDQRLEVGALRMHGAGQIGGGA